MQKIKVEIYWEENNYCCGWGNNDFGCVISTAKTIDALKKDFEEALQWQIDSMKEDGDDLPEWLANGEYSIEYC
jgi:predicted RNase H-like HicB family nuclease